MEKRKNLDELLEHLYHAPWENAFKRILTPFEQFVSNQAASGQLLMLSTIIALIIANTFLAEHYYHLLHSTVGLRFGDWSLEKTLHHWINDGLMVLFFFVVGLEIKREFLVGELSSPRNAALPIVAAIGGMVVPAAIYMLFNYDGIGVHGWGIPMATDIAFAVGVLILLGNRVPKALFTFLVALAIVDDLGAVLVIAIFYTDQLSMNALGVAALLFIVLMTLNLGGVRKPLPYFIIGVFLWLAMLKSGVHATIAGVLTAMTIPARPKYEPDIFSRHLRGLLTRFDSTHQPGVSIMVNNDQMAVLQTLENGVHMVQTPLQRMEHALALPVAILIIPIFALANAGIPLNLGDIGASLGHPIALGIICGLVIGKLIGIAGATWLAVKLGICDLPAGSRFTHVLGVGLLGGIGFTMSIFVAELAFPGNPELLVLAKTGILFASLIAGVCGMLWLYLTTGKK